MNVLVDTNVLLSAALRDGVPEKVVWHVATNPDCRWIVTAEILAEYFGVIRRPKFGFEPGVVQAWTELVQSGTILVLSPPASFRLQRDPKDAIFLAAAVANGADFLITGDKDLLDAGLPLSTRILTAAEFLAEIGIK